MLSAFVQQSTLRARSLGIEEGAYIRLLEMGGPAARTEWMAVAPALVVGETFLFRDAQLWQLIEQTLLPSLSRLSAPLWLWSAGCSTGEEAYTLAIVARRALAGHSVRILATDVNPKAVAAARVGVYNSWSLRGVSPEQRDGLTVNGTQTVRVHEDIKSLVRFETHNLNDDAAYPPHGMQSFELIVCRNVLIYMSHPARAKIINNLAKLVSPGGILILGHGEGAGIDIEDLVVERHDAGVVYRRPMQPIIRPVPAPQPQRKPVAKKKTRHVARTATVDHKGRPPQSAGKPPQDAARASHGVVTPSQGEAATVDHKGRPPQRHSQRERCRDLVAQAIAAARESKFDAAERAALAAVGADQLDPEPHVLLAALMMARGSMRDAETEIRRALFLDPIFVPALWQAGNLYGMTSRKRQAAYAFATALTQLEGMPPETEALPFDNLTVGELTTLLRAELGERVEV